MAGGREPGERRTPDPQRSPQYFNARRLWCGDGSLHDGFRVLTHILSVWFSVLCILEVQAGEFPSLPVTMTAPRGLSGARQHFLCVMECAVSQSQVWMTPHPSDGECLVVLGAFVRSMHPTLEFPLSSCNLEIKEQATHVFRLRFHPQKLQSLSENILATIVLMKRHFVVLCSGPITSCALHNRFHLSGIGHQPSSVHMVLCSSGVLGWTLSCAVLSLCLTGPKLWRKSSTAACTFSAPVPSPQPANLVDVGVFRNTCGTQWCVAGFQAYPGSSRPQSLLRCTDPLPSDCQELPRFFLVSLARSCCQSFPGEPTCCRQRKFDTLLRQGGASISCLLDLGHRVRLTRLSMQIS